MTTAAPPRAPRGTSNGQAPPAQLLEIPVDRILIGDNVRVDVGDVSELAASIAESGILQPLRVELGAANDDGQLYLLTIGHRRLAAAKEAGLTHVPAIVDAAVQLGATRIVAQLVENIQRRDLNALEEAKALRRILDASKGMTQEQLADKVGRSRPAVTNLLRILDTDPAIQQLVVDGKLSGAHAKAIAGLPAYAAVEVAEQAVRMSMSSHEVEGVVGLWAAGEKRADAAEKVLAERGIDKKTPMIIWGETRFVSALEARGWKSRNAGDMAYGDRKKGCDCKSLIVQDGWGSGPEITIREACFKKEHLQAKSAAVAPPAPAAQQAAQDAEWERQREEAARQREAEQERRRVEDEAIVRHFTAGRWGTTDDWRVIVAALFADDYWAVDDFIDRYVPAEERETIAALDHPVWAVLEHLDSQALMAEFGRWVASTPLEDPARAKLLALAEPAKPKRAKKAATS